MEKEWGNRGKKDIKDIFKGRKKEGSKLELKRGFAPKGIV
jgi:hypothetical protein